MNSVGMLPVAIPDKAEEKAGGCSRLPVVLVVAGTDSGGGAGLTADMRTLTAFDVFGSAAVTAVTVQNTRVMTAVQPIPASIVSEQMESVLSDIGVDAVKIGMLASVENILAVTTVMERWQNGMYQHRMKPVVLDPVLTATCGGDLLTPDAWTALRGLFPFVTLLTPNLKEAAVLAEMESVQTVSEMEEAGWRICARGCAAVLVKGGHLKGETALDMLVTPHGSTPFSAPRVSIKEAYGTGCPLPSEVNGTGGSLSLKANGACGSLASEVHGTGCALSSALAALLARGYSLAKSVELAKTWLYKLLEAGSFTVGGECLDAGEMVCS